MRKLKLEELNRLSVPEFKASDKVPVIAVLDNVRSLHNVGSILRTADAFRLEAVYLIGITPAPPHREIRKTAIGAEESIDWYHFEEISMVLKDLVEKDYTIVSVEQTDNCRLLSEVSIDLNSKYALILGHEVFGVSDQVISVCDIAVEIPQFGTKHSLNVSVAAGIVFYHFSLPFFNKIS